MGKINPVNKSFCLDQIYESNYRKLLRLIPNLPSIKRDAIGYSAGKPALHLEIIERSSYTITLQLSHCFDKDLDYFFAPAVKIRMYQDARLAEVIRDHARTDVFKTINKLEQKKEVIEYKWSLNYFLEKWLNHCLKTAYRFDEQGQRLAEMS
jgi:uncharacterized protein YqiB (DUF1249 family)